MGRILLAAALLVILACLICGALGYAIGRQGVNAAPLSMPTRVPMPPEFSGALAAGFSWVHGTIYFNGAPYAGVLVIVDWGGSPYQNVTNGSGQWGCSIPVGRQVKVSLSMAGTCTARAMTQPAGLVNVKVVGLESTFTLAATAPAVVNSFDLALDCQFATATQSPTTMPTARVTPSPQPTLTPIDTMTPGPNVTPFAMLDIPPIVRVEIADKCFGMLYSRYAGEPFTLDDFMQSPFWEVTQKRIRLGYPHSGLIVVADGDTTYSALAFEQEIVVLSSKEPGAFAVLSISGGEYRP